MVKLVFGQFEHIFRYTERKLEKGCRQYEASEEDDMGYFFFSSCRSCIRHMGHTFGFSSTLLRFYHTLHNLSLHCGTHLLYSVQSINLLYHCIALALSLSLAFRSNTTIKTTTKMPQITIKAYTIFPTHISFWISVCSSSSSDRISEKPYQSLNGI